ncbi:MAG: hypothetical protein K6F23_10255 [Solobacterium sp.]|nr:hypothetical protein [Solobacterium sp.]
MNKIIKTIFALLLTISVVGCSSTNTDESVPENSTSSPAESIGTESTEPPVNEDDEIEDEGWEKLESLGKVQTENGIFFVYITVPADIVGTDVTQEKIDANAGETYTSGVLNEDGSVTYKMTKKQHKAMMDTIKESLDNALQDMVDDEKNAITEIRHNKDFTEFDVTLSTNELGLTESFLVLGFYVYGGMYAIFSGEEAANICVNYYAPDGTLIDTANSADMNN